MRLKEITPAEFICSDCHSCPAVFETERDTYVVIGKELPDSILEQLVGRIGANEFAIEIPKGIINGITNIKS